MTNRQLIDGMTNKQLAFYLIYFSYEHSPKGKFTTTIDYEEFDNYYDCAQYVVDWLENSSIEEE